MLFLAQLHFPLLNKICFLLSRSTEKLILLFNHILTWGPNVLGKEKCVCHCRIEARTPDHRTTVSMPYQLSCPTDNVTCVSHADTSWSRARVLRPDPATLPHTQRVRKCVLSNMNVYEIWEPLHQQNSSIYRLIGGKMHKLSAAY